MTGPPPLPTSSREKLALLQAAAAWGDRLRPVLAIGTPASRLREVTEAADDLSIAETPTGISIHFGPYVFWDVTLDENDIVVGHLASGYGELSEKLGIDFSGRPRGPGNGA